jgi:hypothetical protein
MRQILIITFLLITFAGFSQACFTYDAAGNRVKRQVCIPALTREDTSQMQSIFQSEVELDSRLYKLETDLGELIIFPNPSSGIFNINNQEDWKGAQLTVYSNDGRCIFSSHISNKPIDLLFIETGIYFVSIKKNQKIKSTKLFITK